MKRRFFNYRGKRIAEKVRRILREEKVASVLDVGAGTMQISQMIARDGYEVSGCDVIDVNATDLELKLFDGTKLDYPDKSFDCVLLLFVLHHTSYKNQKKLIEECARVSKKIIVVAEDIFDSEVERLVVRVLDYIGNRLNSKEIPVPGTFRSVEGWREFFSRVKDYELIRIVPVKPLPLRPTRHRLFVSRSN